MEHQHIYDVNGKQLCCSQEEKIYENAKVLLKEEEHTHHDHEHQNENKENSIFRLFLLPIISFILLAIALLFDHVLIAHWFSGWIRISWYVVSFLPVGIPVFKEAVQSILKKDVFSEFLLMSIATIGAFGIGEYAEAVAVMLFYAVGEVFQTIAITKAKANIKLLLDQRPDEVIVLRDNQTHTIKAKNVQIGDVIQLKPGEKIALDGILISEHAVLNTAALTGESTPDDKIKGDIVLAGMINLNTVSLVQVTTNYNDSKLSKILALVQEATTHKAPTELFIRKFARIYTPIVVFLAIAICFLPYFFVADYQFSEWLYRSLIFLVISCPCALVISIPLGYFGGIGAASKNGILIKGSNYLDALAAVKHVMMDKTGTLTEGVFSVQEVTFDPKFDKQKILQMVNALESQSTHPIATAIHEFVGEIDTSITLTNTEEIAGHGLKTTIDGKVLLAGNFRLMEKFAISTNIDTSKIIYTTIAVAYDAAFVGYITIADKIKEDALETIQKLHALNVKTTMLSGDKSIVVETVAKQLGIDQAYGDLLPADKVTHVKNAKLTGDIVAFVGDGINDAPVIALSDIGIAMGGLGSDAAIETASVVIQDDMPSKIALAIEIGKATKRIVWQNIGLAFSVKLVVLVLGAGGLATMWEAVFADVGVALLAILNAIRIQRKQF